MKASDRNVSERLSLRERNYFLPVAALVFCAGIGLASHVSTGLWPLWLVLSAAVLAFALRLLKRPLRWALFPLIFMAALLWTQSWLNPPVPAAGVYTQITATEYGAPSERASGGVALTLCRVSLDGVEQPGMAYCTLNEEDGFTTADLFDGALLRFQGTVYLPSGKQNQNDFDFHLWLLQNGIGYGINLVKNLTILNDPTSAPWVSFSARVRSFCADRFQRLMGDEGSLAMAMLLGDRDSLAQEEQLAFQRAGVAHLMAVSGLHVGFLCAGLIWLLNLLPLRKAYHLPALAAFLLLYCWITGFSPAAVRAAVMLLLLTLAHAFGRRQDPLTTLSAAALIVLATNPLQLYAAGFILSFTAVGGILLLYTPILSGFSRLFCGKRRKPAPGFWGSLGNRIAQLLSVSLSAQIGVLLPTALYFHKLPLYGILFNLLAVPLASLLVPLYAVTLLLSLVPWVGWLLAVCLGFFAKWGSWLMLRLVELSGSLPYAQIGVPSPNVWAWAAMLMFMVTMSRYVRVPWSRRVLAATLVITLAGTGAYLTRPAQLRYHQFAAGQGDAALLVDGDQTVAIDVGTYGTEVAGRLLAEGRSLNALILTHLHSDHAKGVEELLAQGISIGRIYLPYSALDMDLDEESLAVWAAIEQSGVPISYLSAGDTLTFHEMSIRVLWPQAGRTRAGLDANERSIATLITLGGLRILSMGDNSSLYEKYIATPCDVLKVGHHGSAAASSDAFLAAVNPGIAIVTCRADAALPSQKTLARLANHCAKVLRTDETGEIILSAVGDGYRLTTYHTGDAQ